MLGVINLADKARNHIDAGLHGEFLGLDLVAHGGDGVHWRADKGDALGRKLLGKAGAFGQEAIAGVHRFRTGRLARLDDFFSDQIGLRGRRRTDMDGLVSHLHKWRPRIGVGIDRNSLYTHTARGLDDPAGNFATVCYEDFFEHVISLP